MDKELYQRAEAHLDQAKELLSVIRACEDGIRYVQNGADVVLSDPQMINRVSLKESRLDSGQEKLLRELVTGILRNRMEEAEKEIAALMPAQEGGMEVPIPCKKRRTPLSTT